MKIKNKGKVHPSPSSSSSPPPPINPSTETDALSVLKLLPAAILALASILSVSDREVLAYMITRSLKTPSIPAACSSSAVQDPKKKCKKTSFDCECFDCYTWYWFRWDSSPNRERIHQVIEAFEEHLAANNGELAASSPTVSSRKINTNGKRKEKTQTQKKQQQQETREAVAVSAALVVAPVKENENTTRMEVAAEKVEAAVECNSVTEAVAAARGGEGNNQHKGLARKVLPDVIGLFNSRLWNLWGPNV